uniref:FXYD domain-containing ion transport regulator 3-like n=1 Tax=Pristiophorus japonicus TaxID=55135 RepID=UPI00398EB26E
MIATATGIMVLFAVTQGTWAADPADAEHDKRFNYDYYHLRVVGLIVAAVLCVIGVIILLGEYLRCLRAVAAHVKHRKREIYGAEGGHLGPSCPPRPTQRHTALGQQP